MKFFLPDTGGVASAEQLYRNITMYTKDATGWHVQPERIYQLNYMNGDVVEVVSVGDQFFGETVECILACPHVYVVCTVVEGVRFGPPIVLNRRDVSMVAYFEGHAPIERAVKPIDPTTAPDGTVTFLFTDMEGSTKLWERYPGHMRNALVIHEELVCYAIERGGGFVFKTVGDAVCSAFHTAPEALRAALDLQSVLKSRRWPGGMELKVRIGIHTGEASIEGGDYLGPTLNRASRLLALGHGGQILLSETSADLCLDHLPDRVWLKALGSHGLEGMERPEYVFQAMHPELQSRFPELKSWMAEDVKPNLTVLSQDQRAA
jgi:class 3 adenylate cyclase